VAPRNGMARTRSRRAAFTLLEIVVALAVSSIILVSARLLFESLSTTALQTIQTARDADRVANGDRLLRTLVGRLEVGSGHDRHFGGDGRSVHFTTWCDTPAGWLERCDAILAFEQPGGSPTLVMHLIPTDPHGDLGPRTIVLASGFRTGALRYLNDPRAGGVWFTQWGDAISAPLALGVVIDADTSIVRIGERS
jgi:prepilin-type N-terminal cleavage/methylation domain-containing protein